MRSALDRLDSLASEEPSGSIRDRSDARLDAVDPRPEAQSSGRSHDPSSDTTVGAEPIFSDASAGGLDDSKAQRFRQMVARRLREQDATSLELSHFVVIDHLGSGGMGTVYRAFDRELGRPVALKLLHAHLSAKASDRLRREARAMAKLSHPNVVQVYEVGEAQGRVFIAMELVEGQTLGTWMSREPRPGWRECVELFLRLGEGLAAAHEEGLIHRDFKPSNAMIDGEGRPRVLDFGLARLATEEDPTGELLGATEDRDPGEHLESEPLATPLTRTGEVMGTPAYMPLEQLEGRPVDARSDQYCFCASLYEAVYGERPFGADTIGGQIDALRAGPSSTPPAGAKVPAALHAVLRRGLDADPERRWTSMAALLAELRRLVAPGRSRWIAAAMLVGAIGVAGGLALGRTVPATEVCAGAQEQMRGVWDDERREALEATIMGTGVVYAEDTWTRVEDRLDEYGQEWTAQHRDACEATNVRAEQSPAMMDRRMRCLHRARADLVAVVDVMLELEGRELAKAPRLLAQLQSPARCGDADVLYSDHVPPRAEDEAAVEEAIERLARVRADSRAGRFEQAERERLRVEVLLEGVEHEPTLAWLEVLRGELAMVRDEWEVAEAAFKQALELSSRSRDWATMFVAAGNLMYTHTYQQEPELGFAYRQLALGLAGDDPVWLAFVHRQTSELLRSQGEFTQAEQELREALQRMEGQTSPIAESETSKSLMTLGRVLQNQGEFERAETAHRRALEYQEEHFGPRHPNTLITKANLAALGMLAGQPERAAIELPAAIEELETVLPREDLTVVTMHVLLAGTLSQLGRNEESMAKAREILPIAEQHLGPRHPKVGTLHEMLGLGLGNQERYAEAEAEYAESVAILEASLGPDHPHTAATRAQLANIVGELGQWERAQMLAQHSWRILESSDGWPSDKAAALFQLARASWQLAEPGSQARVDAVAKAEDAAELLRGAGPVAAGVLVEVERWLEDRREDEPPPPGSGRGEPG
ncbi:MAG: tetratricopeptide repeat protein [Nannocystaceae bacterium]